MEDFFNEEDKLNEQRVENEIKKMKLSLEHGASFFPSPENKMPPEIEAQWLDQVQKFEDSFATSKRILIYDFIGKPIIKLINEIPEAEMKAELKSIKNILAQKEIYIDTICKVDDRELYRFITEELFLEETDEIAMEGMTHHYIYEEFHPNHEHDIETHCKEFVDALLNKKIKLNASFLPISAEIYSKEGIQKQEDVIKSMEVFRAAFDLFKLQHFKITSLKINENIADVNFDINYTAVIEGGEEMKNFFGIGCFALKIEYDYWCINKISIPGISI